MTPETRALLERVFQLLNETPRFTRKRLGLDSYDIAAEISRHLRQTPEPEVCDLCGHITDQRANGSQTCSPGCIHND